MSSLTRLTRHGNPASMYRATTTPSLLVLSKTTTPRIQYLQPPQSQPRYISSTSKRETGPIDVAKGTLKKADRLVSDAAVKGIDKGEAAAHKIKETVGKTSEDAQDKSGDLKREAGEMAGQTKGKVKESMGEVKGKAKETVGEVKGKAKDVAGDLKS